MARALLVALLALSPALPGHALVAGLPEGQGLAPIAHLQPGTDRLIVAYEPGAARGVRALLEPGVVSEHPAGGWLVVRGIPEPAVASLPGVRFVEPDGVATADAAPPDDARWSEQWGPKKIGAPAAWDVSLGSEQLVVGVVDSGVDLAHPDIVPRLWRNPTEIANGRDDDGNGFIDDIHGADCRDGDGSPSDANGHGTHVAGIIGAAANQVGVAGVDRAARIMPLRFLGADGRGRISDAIRCLDYAIARGVRITNHSWGTDGGSRALDEAIARARAAGMLVVTSAGNDGRDLDGGGPAHYPSSAPFDNVVAVAATTDTDTVAASSNTGAASVDLAAPGVGILSAWPGGGWVKRSGTSSAAPHVSAAASLIMAAHPGIAYPAVVRRLLGSVQRSPDMGSRLASGGRLDLARAIEHDRLAPTIPTLWWVSALRTPTSVTVAWLAPEDDARTGGTQSVDRYELLVRPRGASSWQRAPTPWPGPPGTIESVAVGGLRPTSSYEIALRVLDNVGNVSVSPTILVSTA